MSTISTGAVEIDDWIFKISTDTFLKSVSLVSYNKSHYWSNVRFFKTIEDAAVFANFLKIQGKMLKGDK